jgi:hypothetical protein
MRLLTGGIGEGPLNWMAYGIDSAGIANTWKVFGDPDRSRTFTGLQTLTMYLNASGSPIAYTAPDGGKAALSCNTWDLWVGNTKVLTGRPAMKTEAKLTQFGLAVYNKDCGPGTFTFDNFNVQSVPEAAGAL